MTDKPRHSDSWAIARKDRDRKWWRTYHYLRQQGKTKEEAVLIADEKQKSRKEAK